VGATKALGIARINRLRTDTMAEWRKVHRDNLEAVLEFLDATDYYTAPASTRYHLARPGGLAEHSLNVLRLLRAKVEYFGLEVPDETLVICGLGHDFAKIGIYVTENRRVREGGQWFDRTVYVVKDQLPLGHGEKSVIMLQNLIQLTDDEKIAIRWHMGASDPSTQYYPGKYAFEEAQKNKLAVLLNTADYEATYILEGSN